MKIFITGTSRGLGLSIADRLNENHDVVGCGRTMMNPPPKFNYLSNIDFRKPESFQNLDLSSFDVLINNVGIAFDGLLATQSENNIEDVIQVNLISTLILTKHYVRQRLANRKKGIILNISSIIGIRGYAGLVSYSASKSGLDGATRALARELGPKGFRVNSILPGYMETDMSKSLSHEQKSQIVRRTPLGRLATVDDISDTIEFFISEKARFITGQSIVIDGGITV